MKTKDELLELRAELVGQVLVLKTQRMIYAKDKNYFSAARMHAEIEATEYAVYLVDKVIASRKTAKGLKPKAIAMTNPLTFDRC